MDQRVTKIGQIDAVYFEVSSFVVTTMRLFYTNTTSTKGFLFVGLRGFGIMVLDLLD